MVIVWSLVKNSSSNLKRNGVMSLLFNSFRKRKIVYGVLFSFFGVINADPVRRVDFFDASNNHLMFITFEYDNNGNNTAREVYMSDSTFVKRTILVKNGSGKSDKEVSFDFNQDTSFVTTFGYKSENTEMTVKDQFAVDQLGGKVNFKESGDNYEVSQNGSAFNKINYEKDGSGNYNRINISDNSGALMYYALVSTSMSVFSRPVHKTGNQATLYPKGNNCFELKFKVQEAVKVSCDLYSLSGRSIAKLFNKDVAAGISKETVWIGKSVPGIANGVYLMSLTVNGKKVLNEKILIQGFSGGF
jgi:hypothetical protein